MHRSAPQGGRWLLLVGVALLLLAAPVADAKKKKKNKVKKLKQAWQIEVLTSFYKKYDPEKTKSEVKDVITTRKDKGYHDGLTDPEWNRLDEKIKDKYKKTSPMEHWRAQGGREWAPLEKNKMSLESDQEFLKRLTGSDAPQMKRILTGVDPRKKAAAEGGGRASEPTAAQLEGRRNSHLYKMEGIAKEMGGAWMQAAKPNALFPEGDTTRREKMASVLAETAAIKFVDYAKKQDL